MSPSASSFSESHDRDHPKTLLRSGSGTHSRMVNARGTRKNEYYAVRRGWQGSKVYESLDEVRAGQCITGHRNVDANFRQSGTLVLNFAFYKFYLNEK